MARPLRIEYPGGYYHVMNRSNCGEDIFLTDKDRRVFLDGLADSCEIYHTKLISYVLMSNHYHLMLQTPDANLSRCMRHLNGVYTQRYNVGHGCDGTLFRGRYKSILLDADSYLLEFISWIKDGFFIKKKDKEIPASKALAPDMETVISEVSRYYEIKPSTLKAVRRGIENEPRDVAIYLIRSMRTEPLMRVGAGFGLNRYSSVSSAVMRIKIKLQKDRKFRDRFKYIENNILKGQTKT
jgi:REP element-mobilizing transposase RayT